MSSLVLEGVCKRFGGLDAVSNVSLQVASGSITGLIGPNGAGKTTVVNLITGTLGLSGGRITLGEHDLTEEPPHRVARLGISRTFQNIRLLGEATVLDNVVIGFHRHEKAPLFARLLGLPSSTRETRALRERARVLLDEFGMGAFADHPAGGLAYGHQRRVEMMRAVASQPDILLLDEPVAGMNDVEAHELGAIFRKLCAKGMGLLLIEHNIRFVTRLCSHVHVLDSGRVIATGTPDEVMSDPAVVTAYLGTA
jgi:branched-chain amino acid transport system ATP-binding protein